MPSLTILSNNLNIVLIAVTILLVILLAAILLSRRRHGRRLSQVVEATITDIRVEATDRSSGWVIIAQRFDPKYRQSFVFRSSLLNYRPHQRNGDTISVRIDPGNHDHYQMIIPDQ
jgi:hypothetical protein